MGFVIDRLNTSSSLYRIALCLSSEAVFHWKFQLTRMLRLISLAHRTTKISICILPQAIGPTDRRNGYKSKNNLRETALGFRLIWGAPCSARNRVRNVDKTSQESILILKQNFRFVKLNHSSLLHDQHFIIVHDGV